MKRSILRKMMVVSLVFVLIASLTVPQFIQAENVAIVDDQNPNLLLEKIDDPEAECHAGYPRLEASFEKNGNKYSLTGNGWNQWSNSDHIPFIYKKVPFNYGKKVATLVVETQLDSWNGGAETGGAGIMLRSGLAPSAATVFMHIRPASVCVTYRAQDGAGSGFTEMKMPITFPVKLKVELNGTKAKCFFKYSGDRDYSQLSSVTFYSTNPSIYVGLACQSVVGSQYPTANFTGFSYQVMAPEGTPPMTEENSSAPTSSSAPVVSELPDVLPDDPPVGPDVLLSETFTDNSMTSGKASVTNPIWTTNSITPPEIITNDASTNRYLYEWMTNAYYYAGDEYWTDYQTEVDLTFTRDYNNNENNAVDIYSRLTTISTYGYHAYVVRFAGVVSNGIKTNKMILGAMNGGSILSPTSGITQLAAINYDYSQKLDVNLHITIRTVDNKIKVFLREGDGEDKLVLEAEEESHIPKTTGCVGFSASGAGYQMDNIRVTKLNDPLGGDYDNRIGGMWDEQTPEFIQEFIDKEYVY